MPRKCTVCLHPQRDAIDADVLAHLPFRMISKRFEVSWQAVRRHREHIPVALAKAQTASDAARGDDLLAQVRTLQAKALAILARAERGGDLRSALGAIREARGNLELLARLLGELQEGATINVLMSPEWSRVRAAVIVALTPFPEARTAVSRALVQAGDAFA